MHTDEAAFKDIEGRKPKLLQYLGLDPETMVLQPFIGRFDLHDGDRFVLCSDGLSDMVAREEILRIVEEKDQKEAIIALRDKALENGGDDNVTIILDEAAASLLH